MKRNVDSIALRKELIKQSIENPKVGALKIKAYAKRLSKAQGTSETVRILSELLGVSETTIFRDFSEN